MNNWERLHRELVKAFGKSCEAYFSFLVDQHRCIFVESREDQLGASRVYKNAVTGIEIDFDRRENCISVYLIKLKHGSIPRYLDAPSNWVLLDELISLRNPQWAIKQNSADNLLTVNDIDRIIRESADALKEYCENVLSGEFAEFETVVEKRNHTALASTGKEQHR